MKRTIIIVTLLFVFGIVNVVCAKGKDIDEILKSVVIENIEYEDAPINLVITDLKKRLKKMGKATEDLNIIIALSKGKKAENYRVTISLNKIPLGHALRYITQTAGLGYFVRDNTIIIADKDVAREKMEIRTFKIRPSNGIINKTKDKKD